MITRILDRLWGGPATRVWASARLAAVRVLDDLSEF